eukprot:CAMPEP_0174954024 /NCGR_PEP_ID=MMETSP0004_2-20121128/194_1 /TAXON_ID=420556 /ORGANISM="Ochromonas sp., Strain CCMP1393" /LENGTH=180 /DNA_ID=CAMNT_0016201791 /DNA_START=257 /DNA_END=799 /DNA_ORIENTATION=+
MSQLEDTDGNKGNLIKKLGVLPGIAAYFAVMLAPIYGVGIGPFGSMTDFSNLKNRGVTPTAVANEYIVAPKSFTPARANELSSKYPVSSLKLGEIIDKVVLEQPRTVRIGIDPVTSRQEYVQRSLIFRFPDVITFQTIPIDETSSTLAVHSYSVYGAGDLGVNGNRVRTWLAEIEDELNK